MVSVALPLSGAFGLEMKLATGAAIILGELQRDTCQARFGHQHACADAFASAPAFSFALGCGNGGTILCEH